MSWSKLAGVQFLSALVVVMIGVSPGVAQGADDKRGAADRDPPVVIDAQTRETCIGWDGYEDCDSATDFGPFDSELSDGWYVSGEWEEYGGDASAAQHSVLAPVIEANGEAGAYVYWFSGLSPRGPTYGHSHFEVSFHVTEPVLMPIGGQLRIENTGADPADFGSVTTRLYEDGEVVHEYVLDDPWDCGGSPCELDLDFVHALTEGHSYTLWIRAECSTYPARDGWDYGSICTYDVSVQSIRACCHTDGSCTEATHSECTGIWHPEWDDCSAADCPQPGACCFADGHCEMSSITEPGDCPVGGVYLGDDTDCDENPCPQPGACCFADGHCEMSSMTEPGDCAAGGAYLGDDTVCDPNACPQPGACCFDDGHCEMSTLIEPGDCAVGGVYLGNDTACGSDQCGACCHVYGQCTLTLSGLCIDDWQGAGTTCSPNPCPDQYAWQPLGSGMGGDEYTGVYALTLYNGELIAGGYFTTAGGDACNYIARWDGSAWQPLGSGMNSSVYALTVYNGELVAGGGFTVAGGEACNYIARWDGSVWQPLGSGMSGDSSRRVNSLTVYNGELIAGGRFWTAGGVECHNIARWNGSEWQPLESGLSDDKVSALTVYNDELIAGGEFYAWYEDCYNIARWNGSVWQSLGSGIDGGNDPVLGLAVYNGELIAGGDLTSAGGVECNGIARWDGSEWQPLGSGMDGRVYGLTVDNGELFAGGYFTTAGGVTCNGIARWDGSAWQALGSGIGGSSYPRVRALTVYNGELIAGGKFTTAGDEACNYVARWAPVTGACCFGDGSCEVLSEAECLAMSGLFVGYDVPCGDDCNENATADTCDIADGTSADLNGNWIPDECEGFEYATEEDLDSGETVILNPGGGAGDLAEEATVEITSTGGTDDAWVTVTEAPEDLHPDAGGFGVFDTTLVIETSLEDGQFFMTVAIPFDDADLGAGDPLAVDLTHYEANAGEWVLAAAGNTEDSPGHDGPVGDRFAVEDTVVPELSDLSDDLGDYGVFWNPDALQGFAWANVDHTTDFAVGTALGIPGDLNCDGAVNFFDIEPFVLAITDPAGYETAYPDCSLLNGDCNGDGDVDFFDIDAFVELVTGG